MGQPTPLVGRRGEGGCLPVRLWRPPLTMMYGSTTIGTKSLYMASLAVLTYTPTLHDWYMAVGSPSYFFICYLINDENKLPPKCKSFFKKRETFASGFLDHKYLLACWRDIRFCILNAECRFKIFSHWTFSYYQQSLSYSHLTRYSTMKMGKILFWGHFESSFWFFV